jgi:hypothetical protein
LGHARPLVRIGRALEARGWRAVLAFPMERTPKAFDTEGIPLCAAPQWDSPWTSPPAVRSSASMGDILTEIGLGSVESARRQIAGWRTLTVQHEPDLVIADYAPGAVLAVRGSVPCLAVGTGFVVPPSGLKRFPALHELAPIVHDEEETCVTVNAVLAEFGIASIGALSDALAGDDQCVCTLPMLDPYGSLRRKPLMGPMLDSGIALREEGASDVFCYLWEPEGSDRLEDIAACLAGLPGPTAAYLPGLAEAGKERLRKDGIEVLDRPAWLGRQLARSRLVVHGGGHGVAAAAALAGVPQVILSFDIEKVLTAAALSERGTAYRFDYLHADVDAMRTGIRAALEDPVLEMEARRVARENELYRERDVLSEIADICERMVA